MSTEVEQAQQELIEEFEFFDDWMERYQYIIDLGRKLPEFPEQHKDEAHRIHGCQSQVWMMAEERGGRLCFQATSDSAIVSGLIALLMRVYSDRPPEQVLEAEPTFISALGLDRHLSPTRSNGLVAMLNRIRAHAAEVTARA